MAITLRTATRVAVLSVSSIGGDRPVSRLIFHTRCRLGVMRSAAGASYRPGSRAVVLRIKGGYSRFCDCAACLQSSALVTSCTGGISRSVLRRRTGTCKGKHVACQVCGGCPAKGIAALSQLTADGFHYRRGGRGPM